MASKSPSTYNIRMFQFLNSLDSKLQQGKTQEHLMYLPLCSHLRVLGGMVTRL